MVRAVTAAVDANLRTPLQNLNQSLSGQGHKDNPSADSCTVLLQHDSRARHREMTWMLKGPWEDSCSEEKFLENRAHYPARPGNSEGHGSVAA
mmetsp:Transcript_12065/g.22328  ORF Transcript_12065/g.22328 Transcript_12065/m.22328 type:complete len:93 (-) Transcript_12065:849-1127(-)